MVQCEKEELKPGGSQPFTDVAAKIEPKEVHSQSYHLVEIRMIDAKESEFSE
jgi:hypothetical protein